MENGRGISLLNAIGIAIAVAVLAFAGGSAYGSYRAVASGIAGGGIPANMEIAVKSEVLTVVTPLKGTPAEKAGIKSGDHILKIDGVGTQGMDVDAAIKKIRGPKGTQVTLTMLRQGWAETREVKVTRDVINVPIITTTARKDGIYVIALSSFTANS